MPDLSYNLSTGVNQNNLLNVKLDTQERMRDLQEGFNIPDYKPSPSFIPKDLTADTVIQGKDVKLPTLQEAFYSKDPRVAEAAQRQIEYEAANDKRANGLGFDNRTRYQEGQDKFTDTHWWKENNQTMYGFNPTKSIAENEDFLHKQLWDNYSEGGKIWRGIGTFAGRTLSKLVTGLVGSVGDIGSMAWNGLQELTDVIGITDGKNNFWADVSNNALARYMEKADQYTKNSILPTYEALDYNKKGAWNKLLDPYTWTNSFADGAGFLLQFAVPGTIFGKLGMAGKVARGIGEFSTLEQLAASVAEGAQIASKLSKAGMTIEEAKNISGFTKFMGAEIPNTSKFGNIAGHVSETLTGSKDVGGIAAHIYNTSMEAVSETKSGFDDTVKALMDKGMSREDATKKAGDDAPSQFIINLGILSASNAFENKLLQKAIGNRSIKNLAEKLDAGTLVAEEKAATKLGTFFKDNKWGNRIKYYGEISAKSAWWEGYWEENAQTAAQRWARGSYNRQGDDVGSDGKDEKVGGGIGGFFKQMYKQTIDASKGNDREAADSIMAGAVIGVLGGTIMSKISGERKEEIKNKAEQIANFRNTRDSWLNLNTLSADVYNKDGSINKEKAKERAEQLNEKISKIDSVFKRSITAEQLIDPQQREELQHLIFGDYVKAHIMNGTEQALVHRLENWNNKSEGELSLYGVSPEVKEDASKWATLAQNLIDKYNEIKDIKYAAPKDETVNTYYTKTQAIKSIIFDYMSMKDMSDTLSQKYSDLKDEVNPFSKFSFQQEYNENHSKLLILKSQLENEDVPIQKEAIQNKIDQLEKEQKQRKDDITALGDTKTDTTGFIFPKDVDPKKEFQNMKDVNDFMNYQWNEISHKNASEKYDEIIKEYSDPKTGYDFYNKSVDFWTRGMEAKATENQDKEDTEEFKNTTEELQTKIDDIDEDIKNAKSQEEVKNLTEQKTELETKVNELKDKLGKDEEDVVDDTVDVNEDLIKIPTEPQLGTDSDTSEALAYETPFKTVNKETRNTKDENDNVVYTKELVLENSYDHDLTEFVKEFAKETISNPDKYEAVIIKDTEDLLKQRLSTKQLQDYETSRGELGAIVVFREKGKKEWLKFKNRKNTPIIAYSYNEEAFEDKKKERAIIKAKRRGMSVEDALKHYAEQQKIADQIRTLIKADENLQIPVKVSAGSLGVFPTTFFSDAFERFKGFHNNVVKIVEDVNDFTDDVSLSQLLLEIPKDKTSSGLPFYVPLVTGNLTSSNVPISIRIYQAVQAINYAKFDSKVEAGLIVSQFLKNLFYVNDKQYFKVIKDGAKFRIAYFTKYTEDGVETEHKIFTNLKLKMLKSLYDGTKNFTIYEKNPTTNKFVPIQLGQEDYKQFIHSNLNTNRKLLIINKGKSEKVYTEKVNAYFNLQKIGENDVDEGNANETTDQSFENQLEVLNKSGEAVALEDKKADIERKRQEELKSEEYRTVLKTEDYTGTLGDNPATIRVTTYKDGSKSIALLDENGVKIELLDTLKGNRLSIGLDKFVDNPILVKASIKEYKDSDNKIVNKINAKYDAELAVLEEATPEQKQEALDNIRKEVEEVKKEAENIIKTIDNIAPINVESALERRKKELQEAKDAIKVAMNKAPTDAIKRILETKGNETIAKIEEDIKKLEDLSPKEEEKVQTPLEELRTEVIFNAPPPANTKTIVKVNKKEFEFDFENNQIVSAFYVTPSDVEKLNEYFQKAHSYTFKQLKINNKDVYLVKYNKIGKFVILDENYIPIPENKEMLKNTEYKDFKNCE